MRSLLSLILLASSAFGQGILAPIMGGTAAAVASPGFKQACETDANGAVGNQVCTWGSGSSSGSGAVVFTSWQVPTSTSAPATGDVTDASGDTFTYVASVFNSTYNWYAAEYLASTVTAGTTALTFDNLTNAVPLNYSGYPSIIAFEISGGPLAVDGSNTKAAVSGSTSANATTCTSFTSGTNGDLIVFGVFAGFGNTLTAGTSPLTFTIPMNGTGTNLPNSFEYATQTTAGAINPAMTSSTTAVYSGVCMGVK